MNKIQKIIIFRPFFVGFCTFAISCLISVAPVYILHLLHVKSYFQDFRMHIGDLSATLATLVDANLHKQLTKPEDINTQTYKQAITPLVKFHNANPKIFYVYTMREEGEKIYYILDTMSDERLNLGRPRLENTQIMEEVVTEDLEDKEWIEVQKQGKTYINERFETDNYGTFLSAHSPFYDEQGKLEGFVGVDYDTATFQEGVQKYKEAFFISLFWCLGFSVVLSIITTLFSLGLRKKYLEVEKLSKYDFLTGLYNRNTFQILLEKTIKTLQRTDEHLFFVILDIDDFKEINDTYGHQIGDQAIVKIAQILQTEIRESDVLARFGGDEFLIYLHDKDENAAQYLLQRLEAKLVNEIIVINKEISLKLSLSIGYTKCHENCSYESLLNRADEALYISKATGKGIATFKA